MRVRFQPGVLLILLAWTGATSAQNLVVNPGFETGDFTGWNEIPASSGSLFGVDINIAHTGTFGAFWGAVDGIPDSISQSVLTSASTSYVFSFWVQNDTAGDDSFQAFWNGSLVLDITPSSSDFGYTFFTFNVTSSAGTTTDIQFSSFDSPAFFFLDDVSVTLAGVPEPATWALLGLSSLCGVSLWRFHRRRQAKLQNLELA